MVYTHMMAISYILHIDNGTSLIKTKFMYAYIL